MRDAFGRGIARAPISPSTPRWFSDPGRWLAATRALDLPGNGRRGLNGRVVLVGSNGYHRVRPRLAIFACQLPENLCWSWAPWMHLPQTEQESFRTFKFCSI